ncbi:MAG: FAD binding domain-containing protein [Rubrivivax sp.]|nr:FAD binding domain-containing protein [Rubrivivax sp.]
MLPAGELELLRPTTLEDAAALLLRPRARLVAGGTDLLPNLRRGIGTPRWLVDLGAIEGFDAVREDGEGLRLGAGLTLAALIRRAQATDLAEVWPALVMAASQVAGPGHRSAATVGGNLCQDTRCIYYNQSAWWRQANGHCLKHEGTTCHVAPQGQRCHAAYAGDLAPALIAYGATVELASLEGRRTLPLADLYRDDGAAHLTLAPHELLASVWLPRPAAGSASAYRKMRSRAAMDFALAGVAMVLRLQQGTIAELAVGVSGTNSHPVRLQGTEALLGQAPGDEAARALGKLVARQASPMRSTVTAAHYRRLVAATAAERLLLELAAR